MIKRLVWVVVVAVCSCGTILFLPQVSTAEPIGLRRLTATAEQENERKPKPAGRWLSGGGESNGKVITRFNFHPEKTETSNYKKVVPENDFRFREFNHVYGSDERHKTTGSVDYVVLLQRDEEGPDGEQLFLAIGHVTAQINPGNAEKEEETGWYPVVSIDGKLQDPFVFSDGFEDAAFGFLGEGIDLRFSLLGGTSFPDFYATDPTVPGAALAEGTFMEFRSRIVPGAVSDPDDFWADDLAEGIDLYRLRLRANEALDVTAELQFGASSGSFRLDYRNHLGLPFDPANPADVAEIASYIASGFVDGALTAPLSAFTVGFVPLDGVSEYTIGDFAQIAVSGTEGVPEPPIAVLFGIGLLALPLMRRSLPLTIGAER